jgi:hypothetical protein
MACMEDLEDLAIGTFRTLYPLLRFTKPIYCPVHPMYLTVYHKERWSNGIISGHYELIAVEASTYLGKNLSPGAT